MEIAKVTQDITNTVGNLNNSKPEGKRLPKIGFPLATLAVATLGCRSLETGEIAGALILAVGFPLTITVLSKLLFSKKNSR